MANAALLEAVKRKRAAIQYQKDDSNVNEQSKDEDSDGELAPEGNANKGSDHDALLGSPDGKDSKMPAESSEQDDNQTALGHSGGFNKQIKANAPENSKNLFVNPKKDTHDPVDLNKDRNMAGEQGESNQQDEMGVEPHEDVRSQSSALAGKNAVKAEGIKKAFGKTIGSKLDVNTSDPGKGEDSPDPVSAINSDNPGKLTGMKSARSKLDGFLSKMKTNKSW